MLTRMREDIRTIQERDPACCGAMTALFAYPGLHALWAHRINHAIAGARCCFFARLGSHCARFWTGIEIHPAARIGRRFFIDHGAGVVIGETTTIGDDVTLYQGVTLGGTGKQAEKRHPDIGDGVVVGVGASVLGNIRVGEYAKVGAGAVVIEDVPPYATVVGVPGRIIASGTAASKPEASTPDVACETVAESA